MDRQQEHVLRVVEEQDIRFVQLWFTDVIGTLKSVSIAPAELEGAFTEGIGFDGSAIEGLARVFEADMIARPDPSTFQILPWRGDNHGTARMLCDILTPDLELARTEPRAVLKRALAKAASMGFTFYTHPEIEFYLFDGEAARRGELVPVDNAGYFEHQPSGISADFRRECISILEQMGITVEYSHSEGGPGQSEIDLRYADALTTADNVMSFRTVAEEVAASAGHHVTFMPKPLIDQPGNGMHTHLSLFEGERNAFFDPGAEFQLSTTARRFIAGLLQYAPEFTAITNQHVNSYKRLWGGGEAPSHVCWGHNNRSALVRVPLYKPDKSQSARVEYRSPDPAANPYLAFAVILAAGLQGIEEELELPPGADDNVWVLTDAERRAAGYRPLPSSLQQAIEYMRGSELVAETLGEEVFDFVIRNKQQEWQEYRLQVTPYELRRFLPAR
ncbi:MAG TPA: type I glutamate--ammonia ligase [Actinomycetaceae bacterium]|nr:type I glutamate--ammonia ligase [Actinomycetaceae bacterium]